MGRKNISPIQLMVGSRIVLFNCDRAQKTLHDQKFRILCAFWRRISLKNGNC